MDSIRCILVVVQALFCNGQYFLWNKGRSENLTKSLILCFYAFHKMLFKVIQSAFWQFWLLIVSIIDNLYKFTLQNTNLLI